MDKKKIAGEKATEYVKDGMILGLGTGSTAYHMVNKIGEMVKAGMDLKGVPTSKATEEQAKALGIPLLSINEVDHIDIDIDGVDEIDPAFNATKGGGGALFREKIVASSAKYNIWVCHSAKLVDEIGDFGLPVEVLPFGYKHVVKKMEEAGFEPVLRMNKDGSIYETNNHNYILDTKYTNSKFGKDYAAMEAFLKGTLGVLETGFFLNRTDIIISAGPDGIQTIQNPNR